MPNYQRTKIEGACYFFTVVTYRRHNFLTDDPARGILKESFLQIKTEQPFDMLAFCLLPDHMHCIWQMPSGDSDYSKRWSMIKRIFSKSFIAAGGSVSPQSDSRQKKRELGIWQRRSWEHRIRDRDDYWNHVHYIHYNPIKHGLVKRVADWPHSTFHRFSQQGIYDDFDWSLIEANDEDKRMEFIE